MVLKTKGLGWDHTLSRPDGYIANRAVTWSPQRRRKRGRPQHTMRRTRMAELEERQLTWREIKGTAQNRFMWQAQMDDLNSRTSIRVGNLD